MKKKLRTRLRKNPEIDQAWEEAQKMANDEATILELQGYLYTTYPKLHKIIEYMINHVLNYNFEGRQ